MSKKIKHLDLISSEDLPEDSSNLSLLQPDQLQALADQLQALADKEGFGLNKKTNLKDLIAELEAFKNYYFDDDSEETEQLEGFLPLITVREKEFLRSITTEKIGKAAYEKQPITTEQEAVIYAINESLDEIDAKFNRIIQELDMFRESMRKNDDA